MGDNNERETKRKDLGNNSLRVSRQMRTHTTEPKNWKKIWTQCSLRLQSLGGEYKYLFENRVNG